MSVATIGAVGLTDTDLIIPGVPQIPYALLLTGAGSTTEVIEVRSLQRGGHVYVTRGVFGSLPVAHTAPVVVTLYDPNSGGGGGGGGVTVTGLQGGSVDPATGIVLAGSVSEGTPGIATQSTGFVVAGILTKTGNQAIAAGSVFTALALASSYDPEGYYSASLPNAGVVGFRVPAAGNGKLHRVSLGVTFGGLSTPAGGVDSTFVMAAISPTVTVDAGDVRVFGSLDYGPSNGEGVGLSPTWAGVLSEDDEVYFYAIQDSALTAPVRTAVAIIERLDT